MVTAVEEESWLEVAPHVFERRKDQHRVLSAEKTWELLRENLRRARDGASQES
jgi:hypothetical protein